MESQMTQEDQQDPNKIASAARTQFRKRQLLSAAARVMERDGFGGMSMNAVATEARVSVGLIYKYFDGKDDLLLGVIVDVLEQFSLSVPRAIDAAGDDPVEKIAAGFRAYCLVIDEHRHAAVLTYREGKALSAAGRTMIKDLEISTTEPLRDAIRQAITDRCLQNIDVELFSYNLLLMAHSWALKYWYFERTLTLDEYVTRQTSYALNSVVKPELRERYKHLLAN